MAAGSGDFRPRYLPFFFCDAGRALGKPHPTVCVFHCNPQGREQNGDSSVELADLGLS
jgi:hypothetical protein